MVNQRIQRIKEKYKNKPLFKKLLGITLPGFDGIPVYEVLKYFFKGIINGSLSSRGSATAFNFFLAIFPAIIFFFTLIPYIPIDNLQEKLLELMQGILPPSAYELAKSTIIDLVSKQRGGLLSFGVLMMLYYTTSGFDSLSDSFNNSYHSIKKRGFLNQKLISFLLVIVTTILIILAMSFLITGQWLVKYLHNNEIVNSNFLLYLLTLVKWLILLALCYFAISVIYYLAPSRANHFPFFSPGSTFATVLTILTIIGFNFYIKNFASYNALYGSIGTLMIIMLLFYFNALIMIIGFELNASIYSAKKIHEEKS